MTKDNGEDDVLSVVKTVAGNHERNHYSQRQIDVIKNEIMPKYNFNPEETGIIAPYRNQVEALNREILMQLPYISFRARRKTILLYPL